MLQFFALFFFVITLFFSNPLEAKEPLPNELKDVGITEKIGSPVSLNLPFKDEKGQVVRLGQYFSQDKVIIINLVYFNCPMLCNLVVTGLVEGVKKLELPIGKKFEIITISINPKDTPADAAVYKKNYLSLLGNTNAYPYWHFLTGDEKSVSKLADELGFAYKYNPKTQEYSHGAAIFFLTPEAAIARYLYGIEYKPFDLKMAILESSKRHMVSSVERVLLFCYNFDAHKRGYVLYAINIMKIGAAITTVLVVGLIAFLSYRYKTKSVRK
jgi:protein SCO1/2